MATVSTELSHSGLRVDEALHVLSADQRDVLTETLPVKLDEPVAMAVLLVVHGLQGLARFGKIPADAPRQIGVDAPIFLFGLDRQREDFLGGQVCEFLGHRRICAENARMSAVAALP